MPPAPVPANEQARNLEMQRYCLRGEPDEAAASFAAVAAKLTGCPTAMVSIVQGDRQWFMGAHGIDVSETPRDHAFCAYAILENEPLIVTDALRDPRFADSRLVTEDLRFRFYAGFPLRTTEDVAVGTLCVNDFMPRKLEPGVIDGMRELSDLVVQFIRSRGEAIVQRTASEDKSRFLANIGHEIRTPMTAILGFAELIEDQAGEPGFDAAQMARTIHVQGGHLLELINDMLAMAKLEAGRVEPEILAFDPAELAHDCVQLFDAVAAEKQIVVELRTDSTLPRVISSDPTRLRQVLINLLSNAVKFTQAGSVIVKLWYDRAGAEAGSLCASVTDTGEGIAPDALARLRKFTAFNQADTSTTREYGGTGLGLSISHSIVSLLGGALEIESVQGAGTTVRFSVLAPKADKAAGPSTAGEPATQHAARLDGVSILVAEDGADNRRLIRHHLERAGAHVEIVEDGAALADRMGTLARNGTLPDLILADLHMPRLDGTGAIRRIRGMGIATPAAVLTADDSAAIIAGCSEAGFDRFLAKPFTKLGLLGCCRMLLGEHRDAA